MSLLLRLPRCEAVAEVAASTLTMLWSSGRYFQVCTWYIIINVWWYILLGLGAPNGPPTFLNALDWYGVAHDALYMRQAHGYTGNDAWYEIFITLLFFHSKEGEKTEPRKWNSTHFHGCFAKLTQKILDPRHRSDKIICERISCSCGYWRTYFTLVTVWQYGYRVLTVHADVYRKLKLYFQS